MLQATSPVLRRYAFPAASLVLSGILVTVDRLALHLLPAGTVHLHPTTSVGIPASFLLAFLAVCLLAVGPLLEGRLLRAAFGMVMAGASSNLLAIVLLGGAPDYLVVRRGILRFGDTAAWQHGQHFFNLGDCALTVGFCLLAVALLLITFGPVRGLDARTALESR